jgi:ABC-type sugar transport system substrate-binding protein
MKKLTFLVSLTNRETDYPQQQALAAQQAAQRFGAELKIVYADNDSVNQSQQLLEAVQSRGAHPDAIVCHPVGTALEQVAAAASAAGIGWAVLDRKSDYLARLRRTCKVPIFAVSVDHEELGRIQGRQMGVLLPQGGLALYLEGHMLSPAARTVTAGMNSAKPANVQVRTLRGNWTEESGYEAVKTWLALATSHRAQVGMFAAQTDNMAMGARRAFEHHTREADRQRWTQVPFTGCYSCSGQSEEWVRQGLLAASARVSPTTGKAIEMFVRYFQDGVQPPEQTWLAPSSFPPLEQLAEQRARAMAASSPAP